MRFLRTNTAIRLTVGPFQDKTDGVTPETSLTVTSCKLTLMVDDANVPTLVLDTAPTASGGANDMVHVTGDDAGFYDLELAAANVNYLGRAMLAITDAATHCPVWHEFMILPAMVYDSIVLGTDRMDTNTTHINDVAASSVTTIAAVLGTTSAPTITSGRVNADVTHIATAAVSTSTAQLGVNVVNNAGSAITSASGIQEVKVASIAANAITATAINADAITNAKIADDAIAVENIKDAAITAAKIATGAITNAKFAAGAIDAAAIAADAITDAKVASDVTIASVTGAVGSVTGAVGSVTGAVGSVSGNVGGNVTGSVGSVATGGITAASFAANAITAAKLDPDVTTELQAGLATAAALATVDGIVDDILVDTADMQPKLGTPAADISADIAAIEAQTDDIGAAGAGLTALASAANLATVAGYLDTEIAAIKAITDALVTRTNTAQAGAAGTITLDTGASSVDDFYNYQVIQIVSGTGAGQARIVSDYVGSTRVATVNGNWATTPDNTSVFALRAFGQIPGASAPTAAEVADAVWEEAIADHSGTVGSTAEALEDAGGAGTPPTVGQIADAVWDEVTAGHTTSGTFGEQSKTDIDTIVTATAAGAIRTALGLASANLDTQLDALPTNAELTTALGTADDAVLAAIAALNNLSQANIRTAVGLGSANLDTQLGDLPTNAELATALAAADDAVLAAIAALNNLSQANIRTAVGLGSANLDTQLDALPTNAELATALGTADDAVLAAIAALNNLSAAQVNAQVLDVLNVDTFAEPAAVPAATATLVAKLNWLTALARNKVTQTATTQTLKADDGTTTIATAAVSDDGSVFERSEFV